MASQVNVQLFQESYAAGELVSGNVVVEVAHHTHVEHICVHIKGKEKVHWKEVRTHLEDGETHTDIIPHSHKHTIFETSIECAGSCSLDPGSYSYPFSFELPPMIPGAYYEEFSHDGHKAEAKVAYKMKAKVDVHHGHDLKRCEPFVVGQRPRDSVHPMRKTNDKKFMFNKGALLMNVEIPQNVFFLGDFVRIKCNIKNESVKDVSGINVKLRKALKLSDRHHSIHHNNTVFEVRYDGIPQAMEDSRIISFEIPPFKIPPQFTSHGHCVEVDYTLSVECDVPRAFDLNVNFPVVLTVPQPLTFSEDPREEVGALAGIPFDEDFHESTPLMLPENTGQCCCTMY